MSFFLTACVLIIVTIVIFGESDRDLDHIDFRSYVGYC
jgi:hypothetical protein